MYKKQMTLQRIACYATLVAAALVFIYSLGMMTDLYDSLYFYTDENYYVEGAEIYNLMQPFNKQLTAAGIFLILSAVSLFVFRNNVRRKYYIANYITVGINSVLNIGIGLWAYANVLSYKSYYLTNVDFESLKMWSEIFQTPYIESTFWFDIFAVVFIALILVTLLNIINLLIKMYLMGAEKAVLRRSARRR